jgi:MFS-type transporter involved in bile tolerance (Atg22 family)
MGVDALAALLFGRWFDRLGLGVLMTSTLLSALFAPLVFLGGFTAALVGVGLWGIGLGAQESILRATIAGMVPPDRRGWAYGLFNAAYGIAWFLGSALMGFLYDVSPYGLIAFSVVVQLAALPLLWIVARGDQGAAGASRS